MATQIDHAGGSMLSGRIRDLGVGVHTAKHTTAIVDGTEHVHRLRFADGCELEADLIVFSAGIRPRDELARAAGLQVDDRGGVMIDNTCRTSDSDIFAIGECARWNGKVYGLVAPGYQMAAIAGSQLQGDSKAQFSGADMSTKLKVLGVDVASIGDAHAVGGGIKTYVFIDERRQIYKKLVVNKEGTRLLGGILVGDADAYGTCLQLVQNGLPLPPNPEQLMFPAIEQLGQRQPPSLTGLANTALICSCNSVSKGDLCDAIGSGARTLGALKKCTKAASSCGGCAPLVTQLLRTELTRLGVAFNNHMCEHFAFSRKELFHLARVGGIHTFEEMLRKHGRGLGCDVCKPAIASILASCWNDFVLARDKVHLQDSNDHFLANIQKDGTYSVIPRIAAGEVTPEQLITIGEIAKKYGLYTKITGGQRIDMLGAQVHQLPAIWRELVEAGFESGHAYGKAVRTVKSCVGSTWCRYGVQDSVSLALDIENRYKGLRSPHKLKFAVSGCARECAEAQSKDVGVIATEKGWNLYVCGNGGVKPRHAELLASDLDKPTLIRYIDRFLMFYIRTADRLQRTSVWRDNLEGGMDYLKHVVCEDRLGIAAELEADMQRVVGTYACEWKTTISDPQALRRFRHFINSDRPSGHIVFVKERGQPRPARPAERAVLQVAD
jgi:nitrite reductase (NADH) large subunit